MSSNSVEKNNKVKKIMILFFFILFMLIILLISVFDTMKTKRKLPSLETSKKDLAVRGDIISKDNFKISASKKIFKASIDTRYLDINKKDLFLKLFSIYSNISYKKLEKKLNYSLKNNPGNLVLSYNIDSKTAKNLKELGFKLQKLGVFISKKIDGATILRGLSIVESGEKRLYSYKDTLTPVVGYITKFESDDGKTKVKGIKGLEKKFDEILNNNKDGLLSGKRDVLSYISFDRSSTIKQRVDGANLKLNIPLKLQKNIEMILDNHKEKLQAQEIIVSIMESKTGNILSLASSNRFNPEKIYQKDIPSLNVKAIEHPFEPGSIIKPISIALALDKNKIKKNELLFAYNSGKTNKKGEFPRGRYKLGRYTIKDDHRFKKNYLTVDDIFIFSSNIGTLQYAQRLNGNEFHNGMVNFGFSKETGIDLPYEKVGILPKVSQFVANDKDNEDNVYKATVSYGQGMTATFMQVLKAYSAFNNNGIMSTPKIVSNIETDDKIYKNSIDNKKVAIRKETAKEIKRLLIKTVEKGTGKNAKFDGLEIGGKTGTAQIAKNGKYLRKYISSFFGFANDNKNSYTIGVTVIDPISTGKNWYYYYAAASAVPVFKEVVDSLVKLNYLVPKNGIISKN